MRRQARKSRKPSFLQKSQRFIQCQWEKARNFVEDNKTELLTVAVLILGALVHKQDTQANAAAVTALNYPPEIVEQIRHGDLHADIRTGCLWDYVKPLTEENDEPVYKKKPHVDETGQQVCLTPENNGIQLKK